MKVTFELDERLGLCIVESMTGWTVSSALLRCDSQGIVTPMEKLEKADEPMLGALLL